MYFVKTGSGKPIVFLHGWGCDGSVFLPVAKRLPDFTCYLVDLDGFGKSQELAASKTVADYAEDVYAFLCEQALERVTIVGHSFGCRVGIVLAATHPERVERMLFFAPAGLRRFSLKRWLRVRMYKLKKRFGIVDESHASADWLNSSGTLRETFVKVVGEDLSQYARRIRCPVLIVNGCRDEATPPWHAKKLHRLVKGSSLVFVDGDHFALFRSPKAFAETISLFAE